MSNRRVLSLALLLAVTPTYAVAEAMQYSGSLMEAGLPADGAFALRMKLYDAPSGGRLIGKEITLVDVAVAKGRFTTQLDFGLPQATLDRLWMQVEVAGPDGAFEALGKRESLDAKALAGATCWSTDGNAGTNASSDFVGTTDAQPLVLKSNANQVGRLTYSSQSPNVVFGDDSNFVAASTHGATISGGGSDTEPGAAANRAYSNYATIGGGYDNTVGVLIINNPNPSIGALATIAGGYGNRASGLFSFIAAGELNRAGGHNSFAAGKQAIVRSPSEGGAAVVGDSGSFIWADDQGTDFITSGSQQFLVRAQGGVGINMNKPASSLHVRNELGDPHAALIVTPDPGSVITAEHDTGNVFVSINGAASSQRGILFGEPGSAANGAITYDNGGAAAMEFRTNGNVTRMRIDADGTTRNGNGAWSTLSDARVKRNIEGIDAPLATLLALRGHRFEYTAAAPMMGDGKRLGFVAQEVREAIPEWVREGSDGYLSVTPTGFEALTVEAIRELAAENALLREELAALRALVLDRDARTESGK